MGFGAAFTTTSTTTSPAMRAKALTLATILF